MTRRGIVVLGDVIGSRSAGPASSAWLRRLCGELDDAYGDGRIAPFGFTQGDELQGLLRPDAEPMTAVLRASLRHPRPPRMRWSVAAGEIEPGKGPATQRTGSAFFAARELASAARRRRDLVLVRSGDPRADALLDDIAPLLGVLLDGMTDRQRAIGRLLLVDGLRQVDVAERLDIARPTVSVAAERAHVREIERISRAITGLLRLGIEGLVYPAAARTGGRQPA